jgi:hypothetical protein
MDMDTTSTQTPSDATIIAGYFTCWNTLDATLRRAAVRSTWAVDARSVDPLADVAGHDELEAMFVGFHDLYPGHTFRQTASSDRHHQLLRWGWQMVAPDDTVVLDGLDVALLSEDGTIGYLAGFFGLELPTAS